MSKPCDTCGKPVAVAKNRKEGLKTFCGKFCKTIWHAYQKEPDATRGSLYQYYLNRMFPKGEFRPEAKSAS